MVIRSSELSPAIGAEVHGVSLGAPLDDDVARELRALFDSRHLLLFRDTELSEQDQIRVCRLFRPVVDEIGWISNVMPGFHPEPALEFHSDYAFTDRPMLGLSLYAIELAPGAAPTRWVSNVAACETLPPDLRARLASREVVHMIDTIGDRQHRLTTFDDVGGERASRGAYPRCGRPAIWTHPILGVPLLFVLEQQASHFAGETAAESAPLIAEALAHLHRPEHAYEHEWRVGDFAVWDNLALQHGRRANPNSIRRSLRRVPMNTVTTAELNRGTGFDPEWRAAYLAQSELTTDSY